MIGKFNHHGVWAIYRFEVARALRTLVQSLVTPVITTSLYFIVFGSAIGSRMTEVDGVSYGAFIVPGLIMLSLFTESLSNASFGIYFPKFTGTIYEILSAPVSYLEIVIAYVGAAATKSIVRGSVVLLTCGYRQCATPEVAVRLGEHVLGKISTLWPQGDKP
jgi:ABC-2 type transport system permease protein